MWSSYIDGDGDWMYNAVISAMMLIGCGCIVTNGVGWEYCDGF